VQQRCTVSHGYPGHGGREEERRIRMVPALTDGPRSDREFDLDVRLQPVARHGSTEAAAKPTDSGCPDGPTNLTCNPEGGC
jgi:hypothetical protein